MGGVGLSSAGFSRLARESLGVGAPPSASSLGRLAAPMIDTPLL